MSRIPNTMIRASAGSGKTFQLTNRFIRLLLSGQAPERIIALTFTRKAAGEFFEGILTKLAKAAIDPGKLPADMEPGLVESAVYTATVMNYPNGCHVCELEIDQETGAVEVVKYNVVADVGTVMNPLTLHGQIQGGIGQGLHIKRVRLAQGKGIDEGGYAIANFLDQGDQPLCLAMQPVAMRRPLDEARTARADPVRPALGIGHHVLLHAACN